MCGGEACGCRTGHRFEMTRVPYANQVEITRDCSSSSRANLDPSSAILSQLELSRPKIGFHFLQKNQSTNGKLLSLFPATFCKRTIVLSCGRFCGYLRQTAVICAYLRFRSQRLNDSTIGTRSSALDYSTSLFRLPKLTVAFRSPLVSPSVAFRHCSQTGKLR